MKRAACCSGAVALAPRRGEAGQGLLKGRSGPKHTPDAPFRSREESLCGTAIALLARVHRPDCISKHDAQDSQR